jgi:hypothetical protein
MARGKSNIELEEYVVCREVGNGVSEVLFRGWQEEVTEYVSNSLDTGEITAQDLNQERVYVDTVRDFARRADYLKFH